MKKAVQLRSLRDAEKLWRRVRDLPRRTEGLSAQRTDQEEWYALGLYLLALARNELMAWPLEIERGQGPDFMLARPSGERTGIEVARATTSEFQRAMTQSERLLARTTNTEGRAAPVSLELSNGGWLDGEREEEWTTVFIDAIEKKLALLPGHRAAARHDLLVYDDSPVVLTNKRKGLDYLREWTRQIRSPTLGQISIIASVDVVYDVAADCRILPMVDLSSPLPQIAGADVEFAGRMSALEAIDEHKAEEHPTYSMDAKGRLIKRMPDGRRYEVRVERSGDERLLRQIGHG